MIVSDQLFRLFSSSIGASYNNQRARPRCGLNGFDRINLYDTTVNASVIAVGLFSVAKKRLPV